MIQEDYCSFEIGKLLLEKGYDGPVEQVYTEDGTGSTPIHIGNWRAKSKIPKITHQMAMKWLREVHKVFIYIEPFITTSGLHGYKPYCTKIGGEFMWINLLRKYSNTSSDTYEEAVEAAIKYCLENLI